MADSNLVVFDLDKTLVHPTRPFDEVFEEAFGVPLKARLDAWLAAITMDAACTGLEAVAAVLPQASTSELEKACERFTESWAACQVLFPGTIEMLSALRRADGCRTGILTNGPERFQRRVIDRFSLGSLVHFTCISGDPAIGRRKPTQACFRAVERVAGVPAERCLMIGDSREHDCDGAIGAGWRALWVDPSTANAAASPRPATDLLLLGRRQLGERWAASWLDFTGK